MGEQTSKKNEERVVWIFGYASLIWRPDFAFEASCDGYVQGWVRRFYQGSTDHRGVPGAPGRVATLVPEEHGRVWGRAYRLCGEQAERILEKLDHREKGGYERHRVDVICKGREPVRDALVYLATPDNPEWQGPGAPEAIARQIHGARGPSGPNSEYLLELARSLHEMGAEDAHVFRLERALLELRAREQKDTD